MIKFQLLTQYTGLVSEQDMPPSILEKLVTGEELRK